MAEKNRRKTAGGRPFKKGQTGNPAGRPKGVPNKATMMIKEFSRGLFNRPEFQKNLKKAWDDLSLDPQFKLAILYYAFGKPATAIDLGVDFDHAKYLARLDEAAGASVDQSGDDDD